MKDKYDNSNSSFEHQQLFDNNSINGKFILNKHDFELYDEAKAIPNKVIRIKRMGSVAKNERWRIIEDDELKFVIEGDKLLKKECTFLRTIEGINWLISEYKIGFKSFNELRGRLKQKV